MTLGTGSRAPDRALQQVTHHNLFNHPVNLFVAGFIGSPAMNFTMARLDRPDGPGAGMLPSRSPVSAASPCRGDQRQARPRAVFGREVILGIRPSDFEDASLAEPGWARMPVPPTSPRNLAARSL